MKKRAYRVVYIATVILFVGYLLVINHIITAVSPSAKFIGKTPDKLLNKPVFCNFETYEVFHNMMETVYCSGWAFAETEQNNQNKKIGVALIGSDKSYLYSEKAIARDGVYDMYSPEYRVQGDWHGFSFSFSTLDMDVGKYKIAIYDYENEEDYGMTYTSYMLIKDSREMNIKQFVSSQTDGNRINVNAEGGTAVIDVNQIGDDDLACISGWGYIPDFNSAKQTTYVKLTFKDGTEKIFDTLPVLRPDVAEAFHNDLYSMSGFRALIPKAELPDNDYEIEILLSDGKVVYSTQSPW